ncbi:Uncharacterised protein [Streptococcus pneumoniae]|nr:Uncharacterised protein [Streptococcus pneumoniae]
MDVKYRKVTAEVHLYVINLCGGIIGKFYIDKKA